MVTKKTAEKKTAEKKTLVKKVRAKKSTVKKSTTKKTIVRKKKVFKKVAEHQAFKLANGETLTHYIELADALATIESHVLHHHVGEGRHDFANWILEVFGDKELAATIEPLNERDEIRLAIYKYLVHKHLQ